MFCDYGDVSVKRARDQIFWVDFEYFEQHEIDQIKLPKSATKDIGPLTNLAKIKAVVAKDNAEMIEEIRYYGEAKRFPYID